MVESDDAKFQEAEGDLAKRQGTSVGETRSGKFENEINERKRESWVISKSLGAITLISAVLNLVLVGIVIFMVNSLIKSIISEHSRQTALEGGRWPSSFTERNSRMERGVQGDRTDQNGGGHWRSDAGVLPLQMLYNAPLKSLENIDSIILEFDEEDTGESRKGQVKRHQHMYHVESIEREISVEEAVLKFNLTNQGTLKVYRERAVLRDRLGNVVHELQFFEQTKDGEKQLLRSDSKEDHSTRRKLISSNSHKHSASHSLKTQSGYMAAVCKYGCGEMGVTYPYYYRPFFGYGFPLLGTEPYFQSGYGGNVETAMNNNMFNPESAGPRPPGLQATPQNSPFAMTENPYSYPYSSSPGGGYYYNFYPPPFLEPPQLPLPPPPPYYDDYFAPQNVTDDQ